MIMEANHMSQIEGTSYIYSVMNGPQVPFELVKMYNIPDAIFSKYNVASINTGMGLFAEIDYAWISIDNALFMWNYTHPNPELVGLEGQPSTINTVTLARPRKGVFLDSVSHILVLGMTDRVSIIGLSCTEVNGFKTVELFATGMHTSTRGINVDVMASTASGRVFFAGYMDNDIYELKYQQTEGWFYGKCSKVNHTTKGMAAFAPMIAFSNRKAYEHCVQMVVDDSRNLLYTLSSTSDIRVFQIKEDGSLNLALLKKRYDISVNILHVIHPTTEFNADTPIVSINAIPASEATRYHLVATISSGHRIYLSITSGNPYDLSINPSYSSITMQALHVKLPPPHSIAGRPDMRTAESMRRLTNTYLARQYSPGYYISVRHVSDSSDEVFLALPDSGRRVQTVESAGSRSIGDIAMFLKLGSVVLDVGLCSGSLRPPYPAKGNELAVQFDAPATEIAILTNSGVHIVRRRRFVDTLVALIRAYRNETLNDVLVQFIDFYGRNEVMATALAVACGQGYELTSENHLVRTSDPEVIETARKIFIEHGGKPRFKEIATPATQLGAEDVVLSPRFTGIALYVSRLLRSIWKSTIISETTTPHGVTYNKTVSEKKLQSIQKELVTLQSFFKANKNFIEGLSGPEALSQVATKEEELLLQTEHRHTHAMISLVADAIEGISFVLLWYGEQLGEIRNLLPDFSKERYCKLTFQRLFSTPRGQVMAKDLVKAIVNRNITKGSNVETIAEGLRRRCGSFCSAEDVIIFKAQELLKRAGEAGSDSDLARTLLNDSLDLFKRVADCLPMEYLETAVNQYISYKFYAGAIYLCLEVAAAQDPTNRALSYIRDNSPPGVS